MGEVSDEEQALLLEFADQFGLAYQIYDDLLDVTATTEQLGKKTHKDAQEAKNTYPGLLGVAGTKTRLQQVINAALSALSQLEQVSQRDVSLLASFCRYFKI